MNVFNELKTHSPRWSYPRDILRWEMELKHEYLFSFTKACLEYKSPRLKMCLWGFEGIEYFSRVFSISTRHIRISNSFSIQMAGRHFETPVSGDLLAGKVAIVGTLTAYLWKKALPSFFRNSCSERILWIFNDWINAKSCDWKWNFKYKEFIYDLHLRILYSFILLGNLFVKFVKMIWNIEYKLEAR